jgi:hypothetical protein
MDEVYAVTERRFCIRRACSLAAPYGRLRRVAYLVTYGGRLDIGGVGRSRDHLRTIVAGHQRRASRSPYRGRRSAADATALLSASIPVAALGANRDRRWRERSPKPIRR